jgi:flagellar biosynthesis chaperone FliJ
MRPRPDASLEVALEQRQRVMDDAQAAMSQHQRALHEQARVLAQAQSRVQMVLMQIDAAQRPTTGVPLPMTVLGDLERLLDWCEVQVEVQQQRLAQVRAEADVARSALAEAHQGVRALELVLEARRAERAEKVHRAELRLADETAARVHARNSVTR